MIEGILAEWLARQSDEVRSAYATNGVAYASMEVMRAQMNMLFQALRDEGIHVFHCRRVVNRMLYGVPEPEGVSSLLDHMLKMRLRGLDDSTFTLTGQLDPKAANDFIGQLEKLGVTQGGGDYGEAPPQD